MEGDVSLRGSRCRAKGPTALKVPIDLTAGVAIAGLSRREDGGDDSWSRARSSVPGASPPAPRAPRRGAEASSARGRGVRSMCPARSDYRRRTGVAGRPERSSRAGQSRRQRRPGSRPPRNAGSPTPARRSSAARRSTWGSRPRRGTPRRSSTRSEARAHRWHG